jgi:alpha-L-fucosidase
MIFRSLRAPTLTAFALLALACSSKDSGSGGGGSPEVGGSPSVGSSTGGGTGVATTANTGLGNAGGDAAGGSSAMGVGGTVTTPGDGGKGLGGATSLGAGGLHQGGAASGGAAAAGSGAGGLSSGSTFAAGAPGIGGTTPDVGGAANGGSGLIGVGGGTSPGGASGEGGAQSGGSSNGGADNGGVAGASGSDSVSRYCPAIPGGPEGLAPVPTPAQITYQRTEMTSFIHMGMATYDGTEQCNASDPASLFNPTTLDAAGVGAWVKALKGAGFRQSMLVTKHSCGYCLWPSEYTDYSLKNSPWMNGQGDIVKYFSDAMQAEGMRAALYLGPWDQHYTSGKSDYETYFKNQLTEILSYGPAYEMEFDGFNAPTSNVDWKAVFAHVKELQPDILVWAGPEIVNTGATPDVQWIGNENGQGTRSTSSLDTKNCGKGSTWCPYECNVSSHRPEWFWHPNSNPMALADMQKVYFQTVGMNCTLNFNIPPSQSGEFDPKDVSLLEQFGAWYERLYETNFVKAQPATADSTWENAGFEVSKALDDDICTYWAAASGKTSARIEVTPDAPITFTVLSIREPIEIGERTTKYHVEFKQNGTWNTAASDSGGSKIQGTVIGQRQLWRLDSTTAEAIALVIESAKDAPAIAEFGAY